MGELSPIIITGATGFLGRACVAEARRRGLSVWAVYRSEPLPDWAGDDGIAAIRVDLSQPDTLPDLPQNGSLIHCAGHLGDDPGALTRDTVEATRALIDAARGRDIRFVMISSLAVYNTDALQPGDSVTEASPLIPLPGDLTQARDAYAGAKRLQETLLTHDDEAEDGWVLRPGAIWGPKRSWHALQGFWASKLFVTIGSDGELPLTHVDQCAWAAVEAAQTPTEGISVLNVFDDDRPTRARFLRAHRRVFGWPRLNVTVPFGLWLAMIRLLRPIANHLPGLFREPVLRARMLPLRYPNTRLRSALRGEDADTFEGVMTRTGETR